MPEERDVNESTIYCANHPNVETSLRCSKCGKPICFRCAVQTPVGYRCPQCIRSQQKTFYADFRPMHYVILAVVALPLSLLAGWLIPRLGWFTILLGPAVGGAIANVAHLAIGRRRGPYVWLVVCGAIVVGALPWLLLGILNLVGSFLVPEGMSYLPSGLLGLLWMGVYLVTAVSAAYGWLRFGRY